MLSLKYVPIKSFSDCVAYVHNDCMAYTVDDIRMQTRVEIHGGAVPMYAVLNVTGDENIVGPGELGLNEEAFRKLGLPEGANVTILMADVPQSFQNVGKKVRGNVLSASEIKSIINDIALNKYTKCDIASFVTAFSAFNTPQEMVSLCEILSSRHMLHWDEEDIVVDCHSLGDIPGSNMDMLITSIVSAYGLPIPKAVWPRLDSCLGTGNIMRIFTNIELDSIKLSRQIKEARGAIFNYNLHPASEVLAKINEIRQNTYLDSEFFTIADMLAVKKSVGITHLVVDVPVGTFCLAKNAQDAIRMRKLLEYAGDALGMHIDVAITDGREPVGSGIGTVLEAKDLMQILRGRDDACETLKEKALFLAGRLLEFDPNLRGGKGYNAAKEMLSSGRALEAFNRIVFSQGEPILGQNDLGKFTMDIAAPHAGTIQSIENRKIERISLMSGALQYPGAGVSLIKKVGETVSKGETLYRIYSIDAADFSLVKSYIEADNGYFIGK